MSPSPSGCLGLDPEQRWFDSAHAALAGHFPIRATRTGWDYGSAWLFRKLDALGVTLDFSALPGNIAWHRAGGDTLTMDWLRCPTQPYFPSAADCQQPGDLKLLEVPIAQFAQS